MGSQLGGVSFVLRARNEEKYITEALMSLEWLRIPFEVIVILHRCTDNTKKIVETYQQHLPMIRIFEVDTPLSRAGFENLVTPANHASSLTSFYNWCFSKAKYLWKFKWDADFRFSQKLLQFLNKKLNLNDMSPTCYYIPCRLGRSIVNTELYLFNCLLGYKKHVFWELPSLSHQATTITLDKGCAILSIPPGVLKNYWKEPSWFEKSDCELTMKLQQALKIVLGENQPEPSGLARASNKECDTIFHLVTAKQKQLADIGVFLYS